MTTEDVFEQYNVVAQVGDCRLLRFKKQTHQWVVYEGDVPRGAFIDRHHAERLIARLNRSANPNPTGESEVSNGSAPLRQGRFAADPVRLEGRVTNDLELFVTDETGFECFALVMETEMIGPVQITITPSTTPSPEVTEASE